MKKSALFLIILFGSIGFVVLGHAEGEEFQQPPRPWENQEDTGQEVSGDKKMGKGMMDGKKMGMHQQPTVTATSDGGVVVFMGGKLAKYDAALNLVKEVEIKGGPKPQRREEPVQLPFTPPADPVDVPAEAAAAEEAIPEPVWREVQ